MLQSRPCLGHSLADGARALPAGMRRAPDFNNLLVSIPEKACLEAKDKIRPELSEHFVAAAPQLCVECLETATEVVAGRRGETLCAGCAKNYYVGCALWDGLIPQDEALTRDDAVYCSDCDARAAQVRPGDAPGDAGGPS